MTFLEITQLIISILTLIATGAVPIMIYRMQKNHENDLEHIRADQFKKDLSEKANVFLIDHENERDYLPWCVIASALHRQEHHCRVIYTDFCRSSKELQQEILRQAGFSINCIEGNDWVKNCFDKIRADIEKYKLGRNWLYDNAKYFHRGFERYREEKWEDTPKLFELINHDNPVRTALGQEKIDIGSYIDEYYFYYLDGNMTFEEPPISPINYVEQVANISSGPELEVCRWILDVVHNVTVIIHNRDLTEHDDTLRNNFTDAIPETFEDKYYEALLWIYYTYNSAPQSDGEISKRRKKKSRKQK